MGLSHRSCQVKSGSSSRLCDRLIRKPLTDAYVRKLDVVNRGLGGYNTDW